MEETSQISSSGPASAPASGPLKCNICQRTYSRIDHLARHFRSHTLEKGYTCTICSKAFSRSDLLKRHAAGHTNRKHQKGYLAHSKRVSQACKACAHAKLKCKEEKPCQRCHSKGILCEYNDAGDSRAQIWHEDSSANEQSVSSNVPATDVTMNHAPMTEHIENLEMPEMRDYVPSAVQDLDGWMPRSPLSANGHIDGRMGMNTLLSAEATADINIPEDEENMFGNFLRNIMMPPNLGIYEEQEHMADPLNFPSRDLLSFGLNSNLNLTIQDYNLIDFFQGKSVAQTHNPSNIFDGGMARFAPPTPQSDIPQQSSPGSVALGIEAFRQSLWCWIPSREDTGRMEEQNFSLQPEDLSHISTGFNADMRVTSEVFGSDARDKMFAMILSICEDRSSFTRIVSSFPSADLLDNLMHCFLASHVAQSNTYIHVATLKVSHLRPELLGALIAAGALLSSSLTIRKLGFAIQGAVRLSLPKVCEENNSITRELGLLQAFVLSLDIGLWSGNKRQIELAESMALNVVTMCRRASRMLRSSYTTIKPVESDTGLELENKWRAWAAEESFKRLVFHLFIRDAQTSIALIVPNIVSYAELTLPLPSSKALFLAPTASAWKHIYLSTAPALQNDRVPCLAQCLHDLSPLNSMNAKNILDTDLCYSLIAYGIWGLIYELSTLSSVLQVHPSPEQLHGSSTLVLGHRHQELCVLVQHLSVSLTSGHYNNEPGTTTLQSHLLASLLLTHLHVSFNDIQLFAGREGEEESRRSYPKLQAWVRSREARTAVWHAGQVIRYAKMLGGVRDFFAVAVYHASLTFWAYGVLRLRGDTVCSERAEDGALIWVDGEEGQEGKGFIALGRGIPCFSVPNGPNRVRSAKLSEPWNVMSNIVSVLRGRDKNVIQVSEKDEPPVPLLVETLSQLIGELGAAARAVVN